MSQISASVLAVGSELTSGQIINKNASWISKELREKGIATNWHLTVPDDKDLIFRAIEMAATDSDWIFVTGGLGPTSDDFTRDIVCKWANVPLDFDEGSWKSVQERLVSRGLIVEDFQKQQCFFPKGCRILVNPAGTANGFMLEAKSKIFVALPGPPKEIESIWRAHLEPWVDEKAKSIDPWKTKSWDTLGLGESQVAALVAPVVDTAKYEVGYRVHVPYVEFKVSYRQSQAADLSGTFAKIEEALSKWVVLRDGEDIVQTWASSIPECARWRINDNVTKGFLLQRLGPVLKTLSVKTSFTLAVSDTEGDSVPATGKFPVLGFTLKQLGEFEIEIGFTSGSKNATKLIKAHNTAPAMEERRQQFYAENALLFWVSQLRAL
ncbi:MAG: competence/damage-inducible protein A [Bdellovibrionota bacterium]